MSASTPAVVSRRLSKLREEGIILGKEAVIDWQKLGYDIEVSLRITLDKTQNRAFEEFLEAARLIPQVIDCLLYTSPSPRDKRQSRMPSSA